MDHKTYAIVKSDTEGYSQLFLLKHFWHQMCGLFSHQQPLCQFSDTKWVSYSSVQFWHKVPRVSIRFHRFKGLVSQDCLHFRSILKSQVATCTCGESFVKVDNLLEWITELRNTLLTCSDLLYNIHFRTARWKRFIGAKIWRGGVAGNFHVLSGHTTLPVP